MSTEARRIPVWPSWLRRITQAIHSVHLHTCFPFIRHYSILGLMLRGGSLHTEELLRDYIIILVTWLPFVFSDFVYSALRLASFCTTPLSQLCFGWSSLPGILVMKSPRLRPTQMTQINPHNPTSNSPYSGKRGVLDIVLMSHRLL